MTTKQYIRCDADGNDLPSDATDYAIVFDPETNIEWLADFLPEELDHEDGEKACAELTLAGGGWHMPTRREAESIIDIDRYNPARDPVFRGPRSGWMWTSSRDASGPEHGAWFVYLYGGRSNFGNRHYTAWVRPCRARRAPSQ